MFLNYPSTFTLLFPYFYYFLILIGIMVEFLYYCLSLLSFVSTMSPSFTLSTLFASVLSSEFSPDSASSSSLFSVSVPFFIFGVAPCFSSFIVVLSPTVVVWSFFFAAAFSTSLSSILNNVRPFFF